MLVKRLFLHLLLALDGISFVAFAQPRGRWRSPQ
jgi:hypothetical protein